MSQQKVCPWWLGYTFLIPLRKLQHNPEKILSPHVKSGMSVMDFGCAMGYFSIPLAKMTGITGKVYCVDLQKKMLNNLKRRAHKYGVSANIETLQVGENYKPEELAGKLDFLLLFAVAHEVPDQETLFKNIFSMLKPGGKVLFAEPKGHVKPEDFNHSLDLAKRAGLKILQPNILGKGLSSLLIKN